MVTQICNLLDDVYPKKNGGSYSDQIIFVEDRLGHDYRYGLNISKIEKPIFLIAINSLFLIKYLNKKAIDIIITNGLVSFTIDGILRRLKYIKLKKFWFSFSIINCHRS